ncbi:CPBP family intramembrane glutamic endopeptidase [Salisaeta longa]|uniref:CPBP family intramembrane glutamic endopeptidase n=1 Tax=Salisaeta longa TaxID=503170 RepID=UPI0003B47F18|nr:CPBP family intramembrane glutamic endopeptidase [Salisaeta longa]
MLGDPDQTEDAPMTWTVYHRATRSPTYGFIHGILLVLLYEGLRWTAGAHGVRVGAEVWMWQGLAVVGLRGVAALAVAVGCVAALVWWAERGRQVPLRWDVASLVVAESGLYAVVGAALVSGTVGLVLGQWAPGGGALGTRLALSVGAGVYEELVFRVLLVGGLAWTLRHLMARRGWAYPLAALIGALVFSAVHYLGPMGDAFALASFTFRFLFGLVLNGLFLWRGFAVAAWTHALYNVFLTLGLLG